MSQYFVMIKDDKNALTSAVRAGDLEAVQACLAQGWDVNKPDATGYMPLHFASEATPDIAQALIDAGALVDAPSGIDDLRPIHAAAHVDNAGVLACLLNHGADIDGRSLSGFAPLHVAAQGEAIDCTRLLAAHGAYLDSEDAQGCTPLWHAVDGQSEALIDLLADLGADLHAGMQKPLHLAAHWDMQEAVALLLERGACPLVRDDAYGFTAVDVARMNNSTGSLLLLKEAARAQKAKESKADILQAISHEDLPVQRRRCM